MSFVEKTEFLVVDAISSFLADDFDMNKLGVQVMITGSQKALACPPGVSVIVLSDEAVKRVEARDVKCMYLNLKSALKMASGDKHPLHQQLVLYARSMLV